ncbi:hypothetical protein EDS67_23085 [candidate division KSB1 bacterium]|nr:MAG: hypothetical protein EDS67_23085 [candidate division KSB1 bacterium]MBC6947476.1 hypothetical protein [candidate division KSB1 bacterium]MCE7943969.1 hypothetical protein [Chlorobi bacterium CHB1]MDL1879097.1 hypothetical protein [Cytophagia bacterium CHB2]
MGHGVILGVRNPGGREVLALVAANQNLSANTVTAATQEAEVILVSVPVSALTEVARNLGEVKNKIIIAATNLE